MQQLCGSHILMRVFNPSGLRGLLMLLVCALSIKEAEGIFILCGNLIEVLRDDGTWKNALVPLSSSTKESKTRLC